MWASGRESFGDFGAAAGAVGGGFVRNSPTKDGSTTDKRARTGKNIVPVTVRQLLECPEDTMKIEDMEVNTVTILGLVRNVDTSTTKISFMIDDQTGVIEAIQWVGSDGEGMIDTTTILVEGTYGRVVGSLRTHNKGDAGRKYMVIHKVMPVTDMNELTVHLLEVFHVPLKLKRIKDEQNARINGGQVGGAGMNNTITSSLFGTSFGDTTGAGGGGRTSMGNTTGMGGGGFTPHQNIVLNIIKSCHGEAGLHRNDIVQNVKPKMTPKEVDAVIEFLSGEGHIFSTVDDDHYKVTDW